MFEMRDVCYSCRTMKFSHFQQVFFLSLLFGTTGLFLWMLGSYLFPIFWATVITIVFYPLYLRFSHLFKGRDTFASLATVLVTVVVIVLPLVIVGGMVVKESLDLYRSFSDSDISGMNVESLMENFDTLTGDYLATFNIDTDSVQDWIQSGLASAGQTVASSLLSYSQLTLGFMVKIGITLYLLFFMFKYGDMLRKRLLFYLPLQDKYEAMLLRRFAETTQAIMQGTLLIAILQGTIGGLVLWMVGIGAPALWGVVMTILSIIPAIGPSLVLLPAGVYLIVTGAIWQGIVVISVGVILVGLVDDFLRPVLVGRRAKIPDAVVLLATVGGLASFGISGFVIGPVVAAFCLSLWVMYGEKYNKELTENAEM